ncbi:MAG TPA: OmpH family outer membrane protein [Saprospiraceae bacterium]|nr:OmpH family outer membrane protein [Saprospiraceae bacterium]HMQ82635.1 OmpH family outer membrane protein [Saprospiraceae bacterium]
MKKTILLAALLAAFFTQTVAQDKYGHLNFAVLIASMPETALADSTLENLQKQLTQEGETKAQAWYAKVTEFQKAVQEGTMTPVQQQTRQSELEKERDELIAFEQQMGQAIQAKREELLQPIIDKAQGAIDAVAKANQYKLVFDTSVFNAILFAQETNDLMPLVKAQLGIQ